MLLVILISTLSLSTSLLHGGSEIPLDMPYLMGWFSSEIYFSPLNSAIFSFGSSCYNFTLEASFTDDPSDTHGSLYSNAKLQLFIIAWRGTLIQSPANILTDLQVGGDSCIFNSVPCGTIHSGFSDAYSTVRNQVVAILPRLRSTSYAIHITGHSLGGAIALLNAFDLSTSLSNPISLHTFGQPRVGDSTFKSTFLSRNISYTRYQQTQLVGSEIVKDYITSIPPILLPFTKVMHVVNETAVSCISCVKSFFVKTYLALHSAVSYRDLLRKPTSVDICNTTAPSTPMNVTVVNTNPNTLLISWNPPLSFGIPNTIVAYDIEVTSDSDTPRTIRVNRTTHTFDDLRTHAFYTVSVKAFNGMSEGIAANGVIGFTLFPSPTNIVTSFSPTTIYPGESIQLKGATSYDYVFFTNNTSSIFGPCAGAMEGKLLINTTKIIYIPESYGPGNYTLCGAMDEVVSDAEFTVQSEAPHLIIVPRLAPTPTNSSSPSSHSSPSPGSRILPYLFSLLFTIFFTFRK